MVNSISSMFAISSHCSPLFLFAGFSFLLLFAYELSHQQSFPVPAAPQQHQEDKEQVPAAAANASVIDPCTGRYIYLYELPDPFNSEIIQNCRNLSRFGVCNSVINSGLGRKLNDTSSSTVLSETGWYATDQFMLEIIFHNRMKQYECLTTDYSKSTAVYIPFYLGLSVMRKLWESSASERDALTNSLLPWLRARPEWTAKGGRDHFMAIGRVVWDFQRESDKDKDWGVKFLTTPEGKNITVLLIEISGYRENEFGIPYPSYFHPSEKSQVVAWQEKVRSTKRPWLFSFAGARRPNTIPTTRDLIIDQCDNATLCNLLECGGGAKNCYFPSNIMGVFMSSMFCLQPPGDTPTRKSVFDSMVAGCIPVFFRHETAYTQYHWYLPRNFNKFSVYIPEKAVREKTVRIEDVLLGYSDDQIHEMRENIIAMIPTLVYKDPTIKSDEDVHDAFRVAVDGVLSRIHSSRGGSKGIQKVAKPLL